MPRRDVIGKDGSRSGTLLARLRERDRAGLEEVAREFGDELTRAAYLYLGDYHAAADVSQETLIAAWEGAPRTGVETRLRPWLFAILFNIARKELRARVRRTKREAEFAGRPRRSGATGDEIEDLRRAMRKLDPPRREVIILRFERELSVAETAAALEIPAGTVKSRTHTALARLRAELERTG